MATEARLILPRCSWVTVDHVFRRGRDAMHLNTGRAMLGGLVGTGIMTVMMYMVAPMMGLNMDIAQMLGSMLGGSWAAGMAMHFVNGTIVH